MNERYLSRGKQVNTGEWVEGFVMLYEHRGRNFAQMLHDFLDRNEKETEYSITRVDPATVGRCTGLRDKNGILIYEGDVVRFMTDDGWYSRKPKYVYLQVVWECGHFTIGENIPLYIRRSRSEVVGNIYESPELLEGQK